MNHTRELKPAEWTAFFNDFSRHYKGRPVTIETLDAAGRPACIGRRLALMGITAERPTSHPVSIEILAGNCDEGHLMHLINNPKHVLVQQVSNGHDEFLIIESETDPTVRVDFRVPEAEPGVEEVFGEHYARGAGRS